MDFLQYKNNLIKNNILLFDHDYRISYDNLFALNKHIIDYNQTGGGTSSEYYISPFVILNRESQFKIKKLVYFLIDGNIDGAKFVCKNNIN